jgi:hypothetical protein
LPAPDERQVCGLAGPRIAGNAGAGEDPSGIDISTELDDEEKWTPTVLLVDGCGTDASLLLIHVEAASAAV